MVSSNPTLAGAFGIYNYNGPAWATAAETNGRTGDLKIIAFDASAAVINDIKDGRIHVTIAQREYDMGYQSVLLIYNIATLGLEEALDQAGATDAFIDTGVDIVTAANLLDYTASLDERNIPYDWDVEDWKAPTDSFEFSVSSDLN
jgi:ribose transport system substrate-binding protein